MIAEQRLRHMFDARVVGIIRTQNADHALRMARALLDGGFRCVEITMNTPEALSLIETLAREAPTNALIGAGTVMSADQALACIRAGAQFVVSPIAETAIIAPCREAGVVVIPAGLTPTEIVHLWRAGAHVVKVFPINAMGGPEYIRALRGPLPEIPLWVSGAVNPEETPAYLAAGVQLVGLNAHHLPTALIEQGDHAALTEAARTLLRATGTLTSAQPRV